MAKKQDNAAIWRDLEAKTRDLSAWAVLKNGEVVAKLVAHYGGRFSPNGLTVKGFVHILGLPCVRGIARGGGYDMQTAALAAACRKLAAIPEGNILRAHDPGMCDAADDFRALKDQGYDIPHQLREMGYDVVQVV